MSTVQESAHSTGKKVKGFFFFLECACFDEGRYAVCLDYSIYHVLSVF